MIDLFIESQRTKGLICRTTTSYHREFESYTAFKKNMTGPVDLEALPPSSKTPIRGHNAWLSLILCRLAEGRWEKFEILPKEMGPK